jgi:uncharacterized protein YcgL (UPF0745 family)
VGILASRDRGVLLYVPSADALQTACAALHELLGEPVRVFLAATNLRQH